MGWGRMGLGEDGDGEGWGWGGIGGDGDGGGWEWGGTYSSTEKRAYVVKLRSTSKTKSNAVLRIFFFFCNFLIGSP